MYQRDWKYDLVDVLKNGGKTIIYTRGTKHLPTNELSRIEYEVNDQEDYTDFEDKDQDYA